MFIIICSNAFGYAIVTGQLPQSLASFIVKLSENKYVILTIVMLFVFVVGMFMEATANVLLLTPIFLPIIVSYGFDPVHFGIIYMILITMGGMTPPIGVTMYTTCSIFGLSGGDVYKRIDTVYRRNHNPVDLTCSISRFVSVPSKFWYMVRRKYN